jgi:hypothetical protein
MRALWLVLPAAVLTACTGTDGKDDTDTGPEPTADLVFTDANNYSFVGELEITAVEITSETDACIEWSAVDTDIRGRSLDPSTVEQVLFVEFALTQQEVISKVEINDLKQSDTVTQWLYANPGGTSACLSDLQIIGNPFDPGTLTESSSRTWLMSLLNLPDGRFDILMSKFIVPTDASANTDIVYDNDCSTLDADADLDKPRMVTAEGLAPYSLDWSGVSVDVNGQTYDPVLGDELLIGYFATTDLAEVEEKFLRLDTDADELYRADVRGLTFLADLSVAVDSNGTAFGGFTAGGTWLVGTICTTCTSPLPLLLGVVEVQ